MSPDTRHGPEPTSRRARPEGLDLLAFLSTIVRRFYVVLPVLIATGVVMYVMASNLEREYRSEAVIIFSPPDIIPEPEPEEDEEPDLTPQPQNPYLNVETSGSAVERILESTVTRESFDADGLSPDYEIGRDGEIISFEVIAVGEELSIDTAERLVEQFAETLTDLQEETGTPPEEWMSTRTLVAPHAEPIPYSGTRAILIVGFLGVSAAVAGAFFAESIAVGIRDRRRARAARRASADASLPPGDDVVDVAPDDLGPDDGDRGGGDIAGTEDDTSEGDDEGGAAGPGEPGSEDDDLLEDDDSASEPAR